MKTTVARAWRHLPTRERLRCIVVENGASPLARDAEDFDETIAIAQMPGELPVVFAQRTLARLAGVERSGRHFDSVTVLTKAHADAATRAARRLVVLGLSAHARSHGQGAELVLQAHAKAALEERAELLELVGEVTEASDAVSVRLCFGELPSQLPSRQSGVFERAVRSYE